MHWACNYRLSPCCRQPYPAPYIGCVAPHCHGAATNIGPHANRGKPKRPDYTVLTRHQLANDACCSLYGCTPNSPMSPCVYGAVCMEQCVWSSVYTTIYCAWPACTLYTVNAPPGSIATSAFPMQVPGRKYLVKAHHGDQCKAQENALAAQGRRVGGCWEHAPWCMPWNPAGPPPLIAFKQGPRPDRRELPPVPAPSRQSTP